MFFEGAPGGNLEFGRDGRVAGMRCQVRPDVAGQVHGDAAVRRGCVNLILIDGIHGQFDRTIGRLQLDGPAGFGFDQPHVDAAV